MTKKRSVDESAGRTLELPSLFWASFVYVLGVTQRVALHDETKNGSGVALRDEGKNGSGQRLSIPTVTLAVAFFTDGFSGGFDEF